MREVREIQHVSVWSRSGENALAFATRESRRHEIAVEAVADAREAVRDADIICTTTSANEPVLSGAWIRSGTHINAVGACLPTCRELDTEAVRRSRFYMDRRESVLNESGDYLIPLEEGAITEDHLVGEIGDVLLDQCPGRRTRDEVTLFKSLGLAVEDLAAAVPRVREGQGAKRRRRARVRGLARRDRRVRDDGNSGSGTDAGGHPRRTEADRRGRVDQGRC